MGPVVTRISVRAGTSAIGFVLSGGDSGAARQASEEEQDAEQDRDHCPGAGKLDRWAADAEKRRGRG